MQFNCFTLRNSVVKFLVYGEYVSIQPSSLSLCVLTRSTNSSPYGPCCPVCVVGPLSVDSL
jgi:hypothetical protein